MADINGAVLPAGSSPTVTYTITYTKSRPSNTQMTYNFTISAALGSSSSFIGAGMALNCTITVNGSSNSVRIKANDNDNWSGTTPRVKTVSVTCASTTGNATQAVRFQVVSDGRATISSGVIDNSSYTVTSSALLYTSCGAPTACSVNQTVAEGNVTLSWSGASSGTNNNISSYEIQYSDSSDNASWGAWTALTTVTATATSGSVSVAPPSTRGYFRRFQVRTRGDAGSSYYSGWKVSTNSVRKNTLPTMPSTVTATPATYHTESVALTWSGASGGTSAIKGYQIASRTSTNNSSWSAWTVLTTLTLAASSGSYAPTVSRTPGTYTQFGVWTIDALNVYSSEKISGSILCKITPATAPTSVSLSATLSEGNVTLSWSGAAPGSGGPISGYPIQYCDSSNGSTWGAWTDLSFYSTQSGSGSLSVAPSSTRGYYRRFRVRTEPTTGEAYSSDWVISSNTVRRNTQPTMPSVFKASPAIFQSGSAVTIEWSGAAAGTSAIKNYVLQYATSNDGAAWTGYSALTTITSTATFGSYVYTPGVTAAYIRFRICATDTLNCISDYAVSNAVKRNSPPLAPMVEAPKAGSVTYNSRPMVLIQTQPEPDGNPQTIWVQSTGGALYNSVDNPDCFTSPGASPESVKTIFFEPHVVEAGSYTIVVQCRDELSTGASVSRTFSVDPSPFEDITANETHVKAEHITVLRAAANNLRNYYNIPPYIWSQEIVPGRTQIRDWPFHILELRAAVQGIVDKINNYDASAGEMGVVPIRWLDIGTGRPRADVMNQLMELMLEL